MRDQSLFFLDNIKFWESFLGLLTLNNPKNEQLYANGLFPFTFLLKQPIFKIFSNTKVT